MQFRLSNAAIILFSSFMLFSCAQVSKRMPDELEKMHAFLTQDNSSACRQYHYNFERQVPRLYREDKLDSILDVIDYIKTECGPAANLEVVQDLVMADRGEMSDSLIGPATFSQMLWYRSEQENLISWRKFSYLHSALQPIDNTHDNFLKFENDLACGVYSNPDASRVGKLLGQFYCGEYDTVFARIQSDEFKGTNIQNSYNRFVQKTKMLFPARGNIALIIGGWMPQGNNDVLGNHPYFGLHVGGETHRWRTDFVFNYRFGSSKNDYEVDSLGQIITTDEYRSVLLGIDGGLKLWDNMAFSTDIFIGCSYDAIYSVQKTHDPDKNVTFGSLAASCGLRHRFFIDRTSGLYFGGVLRYSVVDYDNFRGTDLSGNTLSVSFIIGRSYHATLQQFFNKLNYKGDQRP